MAITDHQEQQVADARGRNRQDKHTPLLIRDDGMLYPNTKLVAKNPRFRPYHGNPHATLEERMRYLQGLGPRTKVVFEQPVFDIGKADKDQLVAFAMDEYGAVLDPSKPINKLRQEVAKLAELEVQSPSGQRGED